MRRLGAYGGSEKDVRTSAMHLRLLMVWFAKFMKFIVGIQPGPKITLIISIILISVLAVVIVDATYTKNVLINADRYILAYTFDQLEHESDLIIQARVLPGKENKIDIDETDGAVYFGYTITKLQVEKVFYGKALEKEIVLITEEYWTDNAGLGRTIFTQGNYVPAKENQEYIFFLKKYSEGTRYKGMYFPIDLEKGKYLVSNDIKMDNFYNISNADFEIGTKPDEEYRSWYQKVMEKYLN